MEVVLVTDMGTPSTGFPINTYAIDSTKRYTVVAQTACRRIVVQENYNSVNPPTADLLQAQPAGGTQINIAKGTAAVFSPPGTGSQHFVMGFKPGDVAGDIQTVSGSITVQQIESAQI
jgi:hypothetical protein